MGTGVAGMIWVLAAYAGLRLCFWFWAPPNPDEAYYWLWGQRGQFSYYDHPPLFAWLQGIVTAIAGQSLGGLRFLNLITNGVLFFTYGALLRYLYGYGGRRCWLPLITLVLASPVFWVMLSLAWHDHLAIALTIVSGYFLLCYLDAYREWGHGSFWHLTGGLVAIALATITKYNMAFFALAVLGMVASDRRLRRLLWTWPMIYGLVIGAIAWSPVLWWNFQNNWASFSFYVTRSANSGSIGMRLTEPLSFVGISLVMFSPVTAMAWSRVHFFDGRRDTCYPAIAQWGFWLPTLTLLVVSAASTAYYYWNVMAYLLVFPLIIPWLMRQKRWWWAIHSWGMLFALLFTLNHCWLPLSAFFTAEGDRDGRLHFGWAEVVAALPAEEWQRPLFTTDYRTAALLGYALKTPDIGTLSQRISQFTLWQRSPKSGSLITLLADDWHPLNDQVAAKVADLRVLKAVPIVRSGIMLKTYTLYQGRWR
ncbi:MAG: hypothetical protein HC919_13530 [Oscillatoriales cyanobacterium SM2_2_1]|nr:hypothetical protein [Oscillatoriales cyanobacterium SM2_2_1]